MGQIYVLKLRGKKWYVGYTERESVDWILEHIENKGAIWQVGVSPHLRFRDVRSVLFLDQLPGLRIPFPAVDLAVPAVEPCIPGVAPSHGDLLPFPILVKPV